MGKWTRRAFIATGVAAGSALVVGVALRPGNRNPKVARYVQGDGESLINAWVKVTEDNRVVAIIPHSEMGQGAQTALAQMLADELDARWEDVSFIEAPAEDEYANWALGKGYLAGGMNIPKALAGTVDGLFMQITKFMHLQITGGSLSVRTTGVYGMRVAGAAARELLVTAAATAWGVRASEIKTAQGMLIHTVSGKSAPYAEFAAAAGRQTAPRSPKLKTPDQFAIMGKSKPRLDIPSKVDGSAIFGMDVVVDDMAYATVRAAPVFGATVRTVDDRKTKSMPGVIEVLDLGNAVAVVANGYWQAGQALDALDITWSDTGNEGVDSTDIFSQFKSDIAGAREGGKSHRDVEVGDVPGALAAGKQVVQHSYQVPYLAHACMEPMNAVARVQGTKCEIWTGTQNPLGFKYAVAEALGFEAENVRVNNYLMGGGFGRRSDPDAAIQAAEISKAVGRPVKLIWSREEDMHHDHYRPAVVSEFRASLDDNGMPTAWDNIYVDKHEPIEAPHIPYAVANQRIHYVDSPTHVPFGPWRSVDHSQHGFFTEAFIDELAFAAKRDPYEYRRALLTGKPRHRAVLDRAAKEAGWGSRLVTGKGRGIALQESFGSIVAEVVDVSIVDGKVRVDRIVVAIDPGFAVSPDGLTAQMESGVIYGLTAALYGEINIKNGKVLEGNFDAYQMVRMGHSPRIETHIINSMASWGGAGEPGTPATAPALANAIFSATGTRIRELPISQYVFDVELSDAERRLSTG